MGGINVVITMGGLGSRFRKAGYTVPKYMIEVKGKTLFHWSMLSLKNLLPHTEQFIFIAMQDDSVEIEKFIAAECKNIGIKKYQLILIDYLTDGQATTAMLAEKYWLKYNPLLVYNIDTYVEPVGMSFEEIRGDGFIPCFKGEGDHWSFVKLNEAGEAVEVKEKERISENCTIGAYYFSSCELYKELYTDFYADERNLTKGEKYIAPLYGELIRRGKKVYISDIPKEMVHVLGTPEELKIFEAE